MFLAKSKLLRNYEPDARRTDLASSRLYLLAGNNTALETFDVNAPGQLERTQKLDIGTPITQAGLPLSQFVFRKRVVR